ETSVESIPADSIGGSNIEEPLQGICLKQNDPNPDDFVSEEDMILFAMTNAEVYALIKAETPPYYLPRIPKEEIKSQRTPVPSDEIAQRLQRIKENYYSDLIDDSDRASFIDTMNNIYFDPVNVDYYQGVFKKTNVIIQTQDRESTTRKKLEYLTANVDEFLVYISNLSPSEKLYVDKSDNFTTYVESLQRIPDLYKGYVGDGLYLYADPENKIKVKLTPHTYNWDGYIHDYYEGIHPVSHNKFYLRRSDDGDILEESLACSTNLYFISRPD
ncbi:MAG: hypothetical protein ACRC9L_02715, partial [Brevinema sp.]